MLIVTLLIMAFVLCFSIFSLSAYAYIDPGTGSYVLQIIIAAVLGILYAVRLYWDKLTLLFKNLLSGKPSSERAEK